MGRKGEVARRKREEKRSKNETLMIY